MEKPAFDKSETFANNQEHVEHLLLKLDDVMKHPRRTLSNDIVFGLKVTVVTAGMFYGLVAYLGRDLGSFSSGERELKAHGNTAAGASVTEYTPGQNKEVISIDSIPATGPQDKISGGNNPIVSNATGGIVPSKIPVFLTDEYKPLYEQQGNKIPVFLTEKYKPLYAQLPPNIAPAVQPAVNPPSPPYVDTRRELEELSLRQAMREEFERWKQEQRNTQMMQQIRMDAEQSWRDFQERARRNTYR